MPIKISGYLIRINKEEADGLNKGRPIRHNPFFIFSFYKCHMKCYTLVHKLALIQLSLDNPIYRIVFVLRILCLCMTDITLLTKIILFFFLLYYHAYGLLWD